MGRGKLRGESKSVIIERGGVKVVLERVKDLVAKELYIEKARVEIGSQIQRDLGADSLDAVDLIMAVEEEFGILVPDETAETFKTVGDIVSYIEENTEV